MQRRRQPWLSHSWFIQKRPSAVCEYRSTSGMEPVCQMSWPALSSHQVSFCGDMRQANTPMRTKTSALASRSIVNRSCRVMRGNRRSRCPFDQPSKSAGIGRRIDAERRPIILDPARPHGTIADNCRVSWVTEGLALDPRPSPARLGATGTEGCFLSTNNLETDSPRTV